MQTIPFMLCFQIITVACLSEKTFIKPGGDKTMRPLGPNIQAGKDLKNTSLDLMGDVQKTTEIYSSGEASTKSNKLDTSGSKRSVGKKMIKLNMKQGLLMNQVLGIYSLDDVDNDLCRNHSSEFKAALRAFEPWALKMFDSSSKLQSGILEGNLVELGSFKQCIHIYADSVYGAIRGQQCTLKVTPTVNILQKVLGYRNVSRQRFKKIHPIVDGAGLYWSVCIPESCTKEDVLVHFGKYIKTIAEGLDLNVTLTDYDCFTLKDQPETTYKAYVTIIVVGLLFVTIVISTVIELRNKSRKEKNGILTNIFSAYSNGRFVFAYSFTDNSGLACLHGIRFLSICYVVLGHRFLMTLFVPSVNALEVMEWILEYPSTIILGGTVSVDSFFMVSGLLVTYHTMSYLTSANGKFNWFFFILHRYIRLTVPLALTVLVHVSVLQYMGSGPMWTKVAAKVQKPCQYFWWSTILHIQNYINPKHLCIAPTWYLTCDMLYYMFSPFVIYPLWKWKRFGWVNFGVVFVLSLMENFYLAWINEYEAAMLVTNQLLQSKYFAKHYIAPHVRASTFLLGVGCGCVLYRTKDKKIKMSLLVVVAGWCCALLLLLVVILGNHPFQMERHDFNRLEASIFISMTRSAWTLGLIWIVWACKHGYGGPVNYFLSHPAFQVLGKISYSIFLWHMSFQFLSNGALKMPIYFSNFEVMQKFLSDICLVSTFSLVFTICVECPTVKLSRQFIKQKTE